MKTKIIAVLAMAMTFGMFSVIAAGNAFDGNKRLTLKPRVSKNVLVNNENITVVKRIRVRAKADHGSVAIKVLDPRGKTVAGGTNSLSFRTGKTRGRYKIILTNKTKKVQKVRVSWKITVDN